MRFVYSMLKHGISRAPRSALLVLVISLITCGVLLARGSASPQDRFSINDATTTEENGTKLIPKEGFELFMKGKVVVARRLVKGTESWDGKGCTCTEKMAPLCQGGWDEEKKLAWCIPGCCKFSATPKP